MALFNSFKFGDVDSKDYGVYISGDSVYDSPARSVDLVQVPGRNGALALDNGYYENIEVTYPAGSFGTSQEEWREKMRGIRNALAAQRGYQKLIDTYHPEHYRLGMFLAGISASPVQYNRAGQFPIRFNCKPQRFLKSGDEAVEFTAEGQEEVYGPASIASFEAEEGAEIRELTVNLEPIQSGLGDPSPTNIRPISGHTEVNVTRTGKNLFGFDEIAGKYIYRATIVKITENSFYLTGAQGSTDAPILDVNAWAHTRRRIFVAKEATAVTVSCKVQNYTAGVNGFMRLCSQSADVAIDGTLTVIQAQNFTTVGSHTITLNGTIPANSWCVITMTPTSESAVRTLTQETLVTDFQIELGNTATSFEPYAGQTYNVPLGQTVYGGTLNVTTGELTVTHGYFTENGTANWARNSSGSFYLTGQSTNVAANSDGLCNYSPYIYSTSTDKTIFARPIGQISIGKGYSDIWPDIATLKAAFAQTPLQVVYPLATPTTVQLTPTEVTTLLGENNIWADSGEVEVKVVAPVDLTNPTNFASKPNIRVYGNGTVRVGDTIATVQNNTNYIDIDCEAMNCTDGTNNRNSDVSFSGNDFPVLEAGANSILLNGPSKVEITPRWWEL